jgi:hypothetical protein
VAARDDPFCEVELPEAWRAALERGSITLEPSSGLIATSVAPDGTRVFGALYTEAWSGAVAVHATGSIERIRQFSDPAEDQARMAFDGRWLVWEESHSLTNFNDWDIRAWDSRTGEVFDIATAPRANGTIVPGPFVVPVASRGKAAWIQANESGELDAHLYDLASRRDSVISSGSALPPIVFWDSDLLLGERFLEGGREAGHLVLVDASSGERRGVPEPLASVRSIVTLAASEDLVAWSEDYRSVFIWSAGQPEATRIFTASQDDGVDWLTIAGNVVTWNGDRQQRAADVRSGSISITTDQPGFKSANGQWLLVVDVAGTLKKDPPGLRGSNSETSIVDTSALPPLPECPA